MEKIFLEYEIMSNEEKNGLFNFYRMITNTSDINDVINILEFSKCFINHKSSTLMLYHPESEKIEMVINNGYSVDLGTKMIRGALKIDCVFRGMKREERVFYWGSVKDEYFKSPETIALMKEAESYGVTDGFTFTRRFSDHLMMLSFINDDYYIDVDKTQRVIDESAPIYVDTAHNYSAEAIRKLYGIGKNNTKPFYFIHIIMIMV